MPFLYRSLDYHYYIYHYCITIAYEKIGAILIEEKHSGAFNELQEKLREIFQLDRGDLDFGLYRIMNAKVEQINNFLENELLPQVREILKGHDVNNRGYLEEKLKIVKEEATNIGVVPEDAPKVQEIERLISRRLDANILEAEIYSDLYNFFRRYYSEGDFMSLRRYKEGVYALPYEGEEVKLHWANNDQYYIKTTENFKHYNFKLPESGRRVRFEVTRANTEKNNNKEANGKERRFLLCSDAPIAMEEDRLIIRFEYREDGNKRKQEQINQDNIERLRNMKNADLATFKAELFSPTVKIPTITVLEKHLNNYTAKNSFDYFIHKDLGKFLTRELDFYIKNEVMHLDDIEDTSADNAVGYLGKIKAMRKVAGKIIQFLAQLENFQKKLWLKKKFILETHYCVTLDKIIGSDGAKSLLKAIAENTAQREEWVRLFAIDEIQGDLAKTASYTTPLSLDFLKENDKLLVDTKFFDAAFKYRLLSIFDDLDGETNGVLISSENFQALNLLQDRYKEQVKCIYIDPPYNTDASPILYKNGYKHSTWIALMHDRIALSQTILTNSGILCCAIDDVEVGSLRVLMETIFPKEIGVTPVRSNPAGRKSSGRFSPAHEYAIFYGGEESTPGILIKTKKQMEQYANIDENGRFTWTDFVRSGTDDKRENRPKSFYPIFVNDKNQIRIPKMEWNENSRAWMLQETAKKDETVIYPIRKNGGQPYEGRWHRGHTRVVTEPEEYRVRLSADGEIKIEFKKFMDENAPPNTWWESGGYASLNGTIGLGNIIGGREFDFSKSVKLVEDCLRTSGMHDNGGAIALDYFAGSGTTGHAVINLNREDGGGRKYILVEMGEYFDSVLKPRIQKVAYSKDWKNGKPVSRQGVSQLIKYITLEQYEDTLDNLNLQTTQHDLLEQYPTVKEQYMLGYMLDIEAREQLLNSDHFINPFDYCLRITRKNETQKVAVDLPETFNYLLGLRVRKITPFDDDKILTISGDTPLEERCLIVWRDVEKIDNDALDEWFRKTQLNENPAYDTVYINGDNNIGNLRPTNQRWKTQLIEAEFHRLMFSPATT